MRRVEVRSARLTRGAVLIGATARTVVALPARAVVAEPTCRTIAGVAARPILRASFRTLAAIRTGDVVILAPTERAVVSGAYGALEATSGGPIGGASRATLATVRRPLDVSGRNDVARASAARACRGDAVRGPLFRRPAALLRGVRLVRGAIAAVAGAATAGLGGAEALSVGLPGAVSRIEVAGRTSARRFLVLGHEDSSGLFSGVHGRTRDTSSRPCRTCWRTATSTATVRTVHIQWSSAPGPSTADRRPEWCSQHRRNRPTGLTNPSARVRGVLSRLVESIACAPTDRAIADDEVSRAPCLARRPSAPAPHAGRGNGHEEPIR